MSATPEDALVIPEDSSTPTGLCVDAADPRELAFWSDVWNVSAEEVRQAVRWVGTEADAVNRYLGLLQRAQGPKLTH